MDGKRFRHNKTISMMYIKFNLLSSNIMYWDLHKESTWYYCIRWNAFANPHGPVTSMCNHDYFIPRALRLECVKRTVFFCNWSKCHISGQIIIQKYTLHTAKSRVWFETYFLQLEQHNSKISHVTKSRNQYAALSSAYCYHSMSVQYFKYNLITYHTRL